MLTQEELEIEFFDSPELTRQDSDDLITSRAEDYVRQALISHAGVRYMADPTYLDTISSRRSHEMQEKFRKGHEILHGEAKPLFIMPLDPLIVGTSYGCNEKTIIQKVIEKQLQTQVTTPKSKTLLPDLALSTTSEHLKYDIQNLAFKVCVMNSITIGPEQRKLSVIIPPSDYADIRHTKDDTAAYLRQNTLFHEMAHYRDVHYLPGMMRFDDSLYRPDARRLVVDAGYARAVGLRLDSEAYADIVAMGMLYRETNAPREIIDVAIEKRQETTDFGHNTVLALQKFKQTINDIGLDEFRKLDEKSADALYVDTVQQVSMDAGALFAAVRLGNGNTLPENLSPGMEEKIRFYARYFSGDASKPVDLKIHKTKPEWDASAVLNDLAFASAGVITPESRANAFISETDRCRRIIADGCDDTDHLIERMQLLQAGLLDDRPPYIRLNAERGVDIFQQNRDDLERELAIPVVRVTREKYLTPAELP